MYLMYLNVFKCIHLCRTKNFEVNKKIDATKTLGENLSPKPSHKTKTSRYAPKSVWGIRLTLKLWSLRSRRLPTVVGKIKTMLFKGTSRTRSGATGTSRSTHRHWIKMSWLVCFRPKEKSLKRWSDGLFVWYNGFSRLLRRWRELRCCLWSI